MQALGADGITPVAIPGSDAEFTNSPNAHPAGAAGAALWNWSSVPAGKVRILYTATSGTGALSYSPIWGD